MAENRKLAGMAGLYDSPDTLVRAAAMVREKGYRKWDCHTPYPVHGLDGAMGLKPSSIPYFCLTAGFIGVGVALLMQWWMSAIDYPVRIGGKPLFSWPAFVPITFEFFVLFAALALFGSVLFFCRLLRWYSPLHDAGIMAEITGNRYAVVLEAGDSLFSEEQARKLLEETGCKDIRPLFDADDEDDSFL